MCVLQRLDGVFVHDTSIRALTDLLYENKMYPEVLQVFDRFMTNRKNTYLRPDLQAIHHAASLRVVSFKWFSLSPFKQEGLVV